MQHTPVESSNIKSIGYDEATRELEVTFKTGATHSYADVEPKKHQELLAAKSVGAHFHTHIRSAHKSRAVK